MLHSMLRRSTEQDVVLVQGLMLCLMSGEVVV